METVQSITEFIASLQGASSNRSITSSVTEAPESPSFEGSLKEFLTPLSSEQISEEELFSALVQERVQALKGESGLAEYNALFDASKSAMQKTDGYIPFEDATKAALLAFSAGGGISADEATTIYSQSFAAAQLDDNTSVLFDDRGGKNDPTMAVASMEQALLLAHSKLTSFDNGEETAALRDLTEASNKLPGQNNTQSSSGHTSESTGGFLYKPVSDSDGRLVVLLPPSMAGQIKRVSLVNAKGKVIERGQFSGNANGGRDHFRFQRAGGKYPDNLEVRVTLATGKVMRYLIDETAKRQEGLKPSSSEPNRNSRNNNSQSGGADRIDNSL
jgi:hypothetical protein